MSETEITTRFQQAVDTAAAKWIVDEAWIFLDEGASRVRLPLRVRDLRELISHATDDAESLALAKAEIEGLQRVVDAFEAQRNEALALLTPEQRSELFAKWNGKPASEGRHTGINAHDCCRHDPNIECCDVARDDPSRVRIALAFDAEGVLLTRRPAVGQPYAQEVIPLNAENQGALTVALRDTASDDPEAVGYVLVVQKWAKEWPTPAPAPIPLILHCPKCHLQHVDVDDETGKWATDRHHRKHLCKPEDGGCGYVWKPSNRFTVGVKELPEAES